MFLYFVVKVSDEKSGKVGTTVYGGQYFRRMSTCKCIYHLVQFFTASSQTYFLNVRLAFSRAHNF